MDKFTRKPFLLVRKSSQNTVKLCARLVMHLTIVSVLLLSICAWTSNNLVLASSTPPSKNHHSSEDSSSSYSNKIPDSSQTFPSSPPTSKSAQKDAQFESSSHTNSAHNSAECNAIQPVPSCQDLQALNAKDIGDYDCEKLDFCDDMQGFEAILSLHRQLDDDANGDIDISESNDYLRDELKYGSAANDRQKAFHGNDKHITVDELWHSWKASAVHNWSVEQTAEWLCNVVELPQYQGKFELHVIDGIALPRLASMPQFFTILGINNNIHRNKIMLKATDVVLFGVPKPNTIVKDLVMCGLLAFAIAVGYYAFVQHKYSQTHLKKMLKDMEALSSAEKQLESLQVELEHTKQKHENAFKEKRDLELKLKQKDQILEFAVSNGPVPGADAAFFLDNRTSLEEQRIAEMEAQLIATQDELRRIKTAYSAQQWIPPLKLQSYLQFTYEIEIKNYNGKKAAAELQLHAARDECDKLKKKRSTLLGAFRVAHGSSIDLVDNTILQARTLMGELTKEMQERIKRWKMIEFFCGFDIIHNPGYSHLEKALYGVATSASSIQSPTSTSTSTIVSAPSYHAFPRNNSEATLKDNDNVDASSLSSYNTINVLTAQSMWPNSVPMQMRKPSSSTIFTNYPSPLSSTISPIDEHSTFEDDSGLSMIARNDDFTLANNNGKALYNRRISAAMPQNEALLRSKTMGVSSMDQPSLQQKMNLLYLRRGSSDGVEKHFEDLPPAGQLSSQSENTIQCNNSLPGAYQQMLKQSLPGVSHSSTLNSQSHDSISEDAISSQFSAIPKKSSFELNDEITSSSSESSTTLSCHSNHKSSGPMGDLTNSENTPATNQSSTTTSKKRHFFQIRKRKSGKSEKDSKKDA